MASAPATMSLEYAQEILAKQNQLVTESRTVIAELAAVRRDKKRRVELATTRANSRETGWLTHTRERVQRTRDTGDVNQVVEAVEVAKITIGYVLDAREDLRDEKKALKEVTKELNTTRDDHKEIKKNLEEIKAIVSKLQMNKEQKSGEK